MVEKLFQEFNRNSGNFFKRDLSICSLFLLVCHCNSSFYAPIVYARYALEIERKRAAGEEKKMRIFLGLSGSGVYSNYKYIHAIQDSTVVL